MHAAGQQTHFSAECAVCNRRIASDEWSELRLWNFGVRNGWAGVRYGGRGHSWSHGDDRRNDLNNGTKRGRHGDHRNFGSEHYLYDYNDHDSSADHDSFNSDSGQHYRSEHHFSDDDKPEHEHDDAEHYFAQLVADHHSSAEHIVAGYVPTVGHSEHDVA